MCVEEEQDPASRFTFELQGFESVEIVQRMKTKIISNLRHQLKNSFQPIQFQQLVEEKGEIGHGDAASILQMILDVKLFHQNFLGRISQLVEFVHLNARENRFASTKKVKIYVQGENRSGVTLNFVRFRQSTDEKEIEKIVDRKQPVARQEKFEIGEE